MKRAKKHSLNKNQSFTKSKSIRCSTKKKSDWFFSNKNLYYFSSFHPSLKQRIFFFVCVNSTLHISLVKREIEKKSLKWQNATQIEQIYNSIILYTQKSTKMKINVCNKSMIFLQCSHLMLCLQYVSLHLYYCSTVEFLLILFVRHSTPYVYVLCKSRMTTTGKSIWKINNK